jgi:hypothetical protein
MTKSKRAARPSQRSFFPLKVRFCDPPDLGADAGPICTADDGHDYQVKDKTSGESVPEIPHCEWFCTHLAESVGIACPPCNILEMHDGTLVFGSRWEGGVLKNPGIGEAGGYWWDKVKTGEIKIEDIKSVLSKIYAFDNFVYNTDRHCRNFIVRGKRNGLAFLANDYSRAWIRYGFPPHDLPIAEGATVESQRGLSLFWNYKYIDEKEINIVLDRIRVIRKKKIRDIIQSHPQDWLTPEQERAILK